MSETALWAAQSHFVADLEETPLQVTDRLDESTPPGGLWLEAWRTLRRRPLFIVSSVIILLLLLVALLPEPVRLEEPRRSASCRTASAGARSGHPFGFDLQGCDIYSRVIHGARASVSVGVLTTLLTVLFGGVVGALAGFYGGVARLVPGPHHRHLLLGAAAPRGHHLHAGLHRQDGVGRRARARRLRLAAGRPHHARLGHLGPERRVRDGGHRARRVPDRRSCCGTCCRTRSRRSSSSRPSRSGAFIGAEATLSFLGIGLNPATTVSWGGDINQAQNVAALQPVGAALPGRGAVPHRAELHHAGRRSA